MARLTGKQEQVDWTQAAHSMREWQKNLMSNMNNEKFIDLYVGKWTPSESKDDERLRK